MPRGNPLSESQKRAIYNAYTEGEKQADIAATYGVSTSTISRVVNGQRERGAMAAREKIVAGDKANGRLTSTTDPHRFEETCVIAGKRKSRMFTAENARRATEMWEEWCERLRDEDAFMDMVERKPTAEVEEKSVEQANQKEEIGGSSVYVIWAKGEIPRMYGAYQHLSDALADVDKLNDVAAFLGSEGAFEVEEVAWR